QELEPARAVLHVHLDAKLAARPTLLGFAQQLTAQAERRPPAGLADIKDGALGVGDLVDAELARQPRRGLRRQRLPWFVETQPDRHGVPLTCPGTWRCASRAAPSCLPARPGFASPPPQAHRH